jgi:hypothetical protein
MSSLWKGVDTVGRVQTLWVFVPAWAKVAILTTVSALLGGIEKLPLQAILYYALGTLAFAMIFVHIGNEMVAQMVELSSLPNPIDRLVVNDGVAYLEIENRGATGEFCAQFIASEGAEKWPTKTLWCRWDHDVNAKTMVIQRGTKARLRLAREVTPEDEDHTERWLGFWNSEVSKGKTTPLNGGTTLHLQITMAPERRSGPIHRRIVVTPKDDIQCFPD